MTSDAELRQAELDALRAIYDRREFWTSHDESVWHALLSDDPRIELQMHIPVTYPSGDPPMPVIDAALTIGARALCEELTVLHAQAPGSEVVLAWIQHARDFVSNLGVKASSGLLGLSPCAELEWTAADAGEGHGPPIADEAPSGDEGHGCILQVVHSDPLTDRKSTFQAHCVRLCSVEEVRAAISYLLDDRKVARATHNQYAWRLWDSGREVQLHDNDDDGEAGAGSKLAELLALTKANNVLVMVSRWYGGIHLGPDRFKHILTTARDSMIKAGIIAAPR